MYKMILEGVSVSENISILSHELDSALNVVSEFANQTAYIDEDTYDDIDDIEDYKRRRVDLINSLYAIDSCLKFIREGMRSTFSELEEHSVD